MLCPFHVPPEERHVECIRSIIHHCRERCLLLHLVLALERLLGQSLSLLLQLLGHLLVAALGRSTDSRDPSHLELELLVFAVLVRHVDDPRRLLDALLQRDRVALLRVQVQLLPGRQIFRGKEV